MPPVLRFLFAVWFAGLRGSRSPLCGYCRSFAVLDQWGAFLLLTHWFIRLVSLVVYHFLTEVDEFFIRKMSLCLICFRAEYLEIVQGIVPTPCDWYDMIVLIILGIIPIEWSSGQGAREMIPVLFMYVLVIKSHCLLELMRFLRYCL